MGKNFKETLNKQLENKDFKTAYDKLEPEYHLINAILDARKAQNLTQKELATKVGIAQSDLSKLETGNSNPTIKMLQRLADGLGMNVKVEFVPKQ